LLYSLFYCNKQSSKLVTDLKKRHHLILSVLLTSEIFLKKLVTNRTLLNKVLQKHVTKIILTKKLKKKLL